MSLQEQVESLYERPVDGLGVDARAVFEAFRDGLEKGTVRAAEPFAGGWRVNGWVKKGILLGFRLGKVVPMEPVGPLRFADKDTYPARRSVPDGVRIVPGGSAVRSGAYLGPGPRPTSTSAPTSAKARWWIPTRWSAPAPRSAGACTSRPGP